MIAAGSAGDGCEANDTVSSTTTTRYCYDEFNRQVFASPTTADNPWYTSYDGLDRRDTRTKKSLGMDTELREYSYVGTSEMLANEQYQRGLLLLESKSHTYDYDSRGDRLGQSSKVPNADSTFRAYAKDANGSTTGLEQADGAIAGNDTYDYDPYGDLDRKPSLVNPGNPEADLSIEARDNPFRFQGFYYDSGLKTYDMHARAYRPDVGRFLSQDTFASAAGDQALQADPLTQNRYAFAGANPVTNVEFDGHAWDFWGWLKSALTPKKPRKAAPRGNADAKPAPSRTQQRETQAVANMQAAAKAGDQKRYWANAAELGRIRQSGLDARAEATRSAVRRAENDVPDGVSAKEWFKALVFDYTDPLDYLATAVSWVPFAGWGAKGAKKADSVRGVKRTMDAINRGRKRVDAATSKAQGALDDAVANSDFTDLATRCANSFVAGTPVLMADGSRKTIEQVRVGDLVLAYNEATGQNEPQPVTHLIRGAGYKLLYDITAGGRTLTATANHPFMRANGEWATAHQLNPGDKVLDAQGRSVLVEAAVEKAGFTRVYNLTVAAAHTFYAGSTPVLVHNDSCQLQLFPTEAYNRRRHYGNTPTTAQRKSVPRGMEFDHDPMLVLAWTPGSC